MIVLLTVIALMLIHGTFVAAEYAFVNIARQREITDGVDFRSHRSQHILTALEDYLVLCQLAKTIVLLTIGILLGLFLVDLSCSSPFAIITQWDQWVLFTLGFGAIVVLHLIIGVELPQAIALQRSERTIEVLGFQLKLCLWLLYPLLLLINKTRRI